VQSCPRVSRVMHELLSQTKQETGAWVGLSVVHLGDRDVPVRQKLCWPSTSASILNFFSIIQNALIFIDKVRKQLSCKVFN